MGYTHYWCRIKDLSNGWKDFVADVQKLYENLLLVSYWEERRFHTNEKLEISGWNGKGNPKFNKDIVVFNGSGALAHETFMFPRTLPITERYLPPKNGYYFEFCKTARKPYDLFVIVILLLAKKHFGKNIKISSDGSWEDWEGGRQLLKNILNYEFENSIFIER